VAVLIFVGKLFLILLAAIIVLILLFLIIPFNYYINFKYDNGMTANFKLLWKKIIGIIGTYDSAGASEAKLIIFNKEIAYKFKYKFNYKFNYKKKEKSKGNMRDLLDKDFLKQLFSSAKKVIDIIKPEVFNVKLVYGFDDPSITGCLSGLIYYLETLLPKGDFDIQPVYDAEIIYFNMNAEGRINMGAVLVQFMRFILKKDVRNKFKNIKKAETFS